jgi:flagellar biosynthesis/type III secretory pathway protein FliH
MTLSNAYPHAPKRIWADSPTLKRRLDPNVDYEKQPWDVRASSFATWQPVVLSAAEIAALTPQHRVDAHGSPVSEQPQDFVADDAPDADTDNETGGAQNRNENTAPAAAPVATTDAAKAADEAVRSTQPQGDHHNKTQELSEGEGHGQGQESVEPFVELSVGDEQQAATSNASDAMDLNAEALAQLKQDAFDAGHAQGLSEGLAEGEAAGHSAAQAELATALSALAQAARGISTLNDDPVQHFEPLKRLALHLAEELVRGELMLGSAAIERLVQAALEHLDNPAKRVRVALHPDDMAQLGADAKQLGAGVVMVADKAMLRGSVRVTNNDAVIQDLIDNRLSHLADELLIDTSQWRAHSQALKQGAQWGGQASVLQRMQATEDAQEVAVQRTAVSEAQDTGLAAQPVRSDSGGAVDELDAADDSHADNPAAARMETMMDTMAPDRMTGLDAMSAADALDDEPTSYGLDSGTSQTVAPLESAQAPEVQAEHASDGDQPLGVIQAPGVDPAPNTDNDNDSCNSNTNTNTNTNTNSGPVDQHDPT